MKPFCFVELLFLTSLTSASTLLLLLYHSERLGFGGITAANDGHFKAVDDGNPIDEPLVLKSIPDHWVQRCSNFRDPTYFQHGAECGAPLSAPCFDHSRCLRGGGSDALHKIYVYDNEVGVVCELVCVASHLLLITNCLLSYIDRALPCWQAQGSDLGSRHPSDLASHHRNLGQRTNSTLGGRAAYLAKIVNSILYYSTANTPKA